MLCACASWGAARHSAACHCLLVVCIVCIHTLRADLMECGRRYVHGWSRAGYIASFEFTALLRLPLPLCPSLQSHSQTPLHFASEQGRVEAVRLLLDHGATEVINLPGGAGKAAWLR